MSDSNPRVRTSAKAIIFDAGRQKILFIEHPDKETPYYTLPGGGQEHGENLLETLQRECEEEIGTRVKIEKLRMVRDYIARNHEFAEATPHFHQVEFFFSCILEDSSAAMMGPIPDKTQTGIKWLTLSELESSRIYPKVFRTLLFRLASGESVPFYLGDVN